MLRNISYIYSSNLINGLLGLIAVPIGLHQLGVTNYGLFAIYLIFVTYNQFLELGMNKNLSRHLAQAENIGEQVTHLRTAITIFVLLSLILLVLSPLIIYVTANYIFPVPKSAYWTLKVIIFLGIIDYLLSIPTNIIKANCAAQEKFKHYAQFSLWSGIFRYTLTISAFFLFKPVYWIVLFILSYRLIDLLLAKYLMIKLPAQSWRLNFNLKQIKSMFEQTALLSGVQISQTIMLTIGSVITNYFFGLATLGVYQAAFNIASKLWFFSNGIGLVIFPRFSKLIQQPESKRQAFLDTLKLTLRVSWLGYLLLAGIVILCSSFFLKLFHIQQENIHQLLIILFVAIAMNAHSDIAYNYLQASKIYWISFFLIIATTISLALTSLYLKPALGVMAIGWAWLLSQFLYALVADSFVTKWDIGSVIWKSLATFCLVLIIKNLAINILISYLLLGAIVAWFFIALYSYRYCFVEAWLK